MVVVLLLAAAGCSGGDEAVAPTTTDPRAGTTVAAEGSGASIVARSQAPGEGGVVVDEVSLERPGFVALLEDGDGAPGRLLGSSELLEAGEHEDVRVALEEDVAGSAVFVVPFADEDGNGELGWPTPDMPVGGETGIVLVRIELSG